MILAHHISLPKVGERANGDRPLFRVDEVQRALLAVIDGLGHGPDAAQAAKAATDYLESVRLDIALADLMRRLHDVLSGTRGAAGTVCILRAGVLEACAVGNVELRSDFRIPLVASAGVLGVRVAKFRTCEVAIKGRSRFVLFSDGISSRTPLSDVRGLSPEAACQTIMRSYRRKEDDATILVADVE